MSETIADLSFDFSINLAKWQSMLQQAQQMVNNFRQQVERPMNFGGGGGGGMPGGGVAGGHGGFAPMTGSGVPTTSAGPNFTGTSTSNVTQQVAGATQAARSAISQAQAAPQAAAWQLQGSGFYAGAGVPFSVGKHGMGSPFGGNFSAGGFGGGFAIPGAVGMGGTGYHGPGYGHAIGPTPWGGGDPMASPGVSPIGAAIEASRRAQVMQEQAKEKERLMMRAFPVGVSPGVSPIRAELDRRDEVMFQQQVKLDKMREGYSSPIGPQRFGGFDVNASRPSGLNFSNGMTAGNGGQVQGDTISVRGAGNRGIMDSISEALSGPSNQVSFGGGAGGGGMGNRLSQMGKMGLRNLVYGTVLGLVADVMAQGVGAASQYSANMMLTGSDQGKKALLLSGSIRQGVGAVPIIGGALSSLVGAMGFDASDAQVALAGLQDQSTAASTASGMFGTQGRLRSRAARGGSFTAMDTAQRLSEVSIRQESGKQSAASMAAWDAAHPEKPGLGGAMGLGISLAGGGGTDSDRDAQKALYRNYVARQSAAALKGVTDEGGRLAREKQFTLSSAENELARSKMENRFAPGRASGEYAVSQLGSMAAAMGPDASRQDMDYLRTQGGIMKEGLRSEQRDVVNNLIYGKAVQYNPYTTTPLANMERSSETDQMKFDSLQNSIDKLTAQIAALQKGI